MVEITLDRDRDPDDSKLRDLLEAHYTYERISAARSFSVHLLVVVSVLVWLDAAWPSLLPMGMRVFALGLWGMFFCLALWMSIEEWFWRRRQTRYLAWYRGKRKEP
ncbi:MAG: hypothetical protein AB7G75_05580 [Candidatus Binatia bacterium]